MGMDSGYSLSDIAAVTDGNKENMFGGNWIWIIVLFLFAFGGFGGGFGANGVNGALTRAEMFDGFNNQTVVNKLDGIANGLCDGFYAQNTTMLQGFNGVDKAICNLGYQTQQCCCETNRNIDAVRYENAQNTCAITNAIHADGEATRALLRDQEIQTLRDNLQSAQLTIGNTAQTQYILGQLGRYATFAPAFPCNPCGCGCGSLV